MSEAGGCSHELEAKRSGFDKLARVYRWMEYLSFGSALQRCRTKFLLQVCDAKDVIVLGDGDGRFCAALLRAAPSARVTAVDESARMLDRLRLRVDRDGNTDRLTLLHADATATLPCGPFDLVCTHFFLDCLTAQAVDTLAAELRLRCQNGQWLVSEFAVPAGPARWPAAAVVHGLYLAFRLLTGLRTRHLPDYASALRRSGFVLCAAHSRLGGLLRAELWQATSTSAAPVKAASNRVEEHHAH